MQNPIPYIKTTIIKHQSFFTTLGLLTILFLISLISNVVYGALTNNSPKDEFATPYGDCNIQGVSIRGDLFTSIPYDIDGKPELGYEGTSSGDDILELLYRAEYDDNIYGTLIEVDSYGGSPAAAEEIADAIRKAQKPVVAYIREAGVSAAYFAIAPADHILALKSSNVGSLGVTQSYLDNVSRNEKDGLSYVQLSTGKFKDAGNPDKPLTEEERELFMRDLNIINENFIQDIAKSRNIQIEKVRELADGSSMLGEQAQRVGLVDEVGGYDEALVYLDGAIGELASVCW